MQKIVLHPGGKRLILGISWFVFYSISGLTLHANTNLSVNPYTAYVALILGLSIFSFIIMQNQDFKNELSQFFSIQAGKEISKKYFVFPIIFLYTILFHYTFIVRPNLPLDLGQNVGSLHTGRYTLLGETIRQCSFVPIIRENLGQTIFSANIAEFWPYSLVEIRSFIHLMTLLAILSIASGAIRNIFPKISENIIVLALIIFFYGTYSLSFAFTLVNDSGNPLGFVGYADTIYGLFLVLVIVLIYHLRANFSFLVITGFFTLFMLQALVSAPQSLIIISFSLITVLVFRPSPGSRKGVGRPFLLAGVLSLIIWGGAIGMLKVDSSSMNTNIPGTISLEFGGLTDLISTETLSPGLPYLVGNMLSLSEISPKIIDLAKDAQSYVSDPQRFIWTLEQIVLSTLRVTFWPFLGLLLASVIVLRFAHRSRISEFNTPFLRDLVHFSLPLFSFGLAFSFFFSLPNRKWEMSRFLFPSLAFMMFLLVASIIFFLSSRRRSRLVLSVYAFLMIIPVVIYSEASVDQFFKRSSLIPVVQTDFGLIGFLQDPLILPCEAWENPPSV